MQRNVTPHLVHVRPLINVIMTPFFHVTTSHTNIAFRSKLYDVYLHSLIIISKKKIKTIYTLGFDVSRSGSCSGYSWDISWQTKGGDQPLLGVSAEELVGSDVNIDTSALIDGGTWIRPIRGDMLRVPKDQPQVSRFKLTHIIFR